MRAAEREELVRRGTAEIGVHEEHASVLRLSQRAGQVDGCRALSVAHAGARDRYDAEVARLVELFDGVAEGPVLLGLEGGRGDQADQMVVHALGRIRRWCLDHRRLNGLDFGGGRSRCSPRFGRATLLKSAVPVGLLERLEELAHSLMKLLTACASKERVAVERSRIRRSSS